MNFRTQLLTIGFAGLFGALAIGAASWYSQHTYSAALEVAARNSIALRNHMEGDMMHDALRADLQRALWVSNEKNMEEAAEVKEDVKEHSEKFRDRVNENKKLKLSSSARAALDELDASLEIYIALAQEHVDRAFSDLAGERVQLPKFNVAFSDLEEKMGAASDKLQAAAAIDAARSKAEVSAANWLQLFMIVVSGAASILLALRVANSVMGDLGGEPADAVSAAKRISSGDYEANGSSTRAPNNSLLGQMEFMRSQLATNAVQFLENQRIKQSLDAASTNVMLVDKNRNIIYLNHAIKIFMQRLSADFSREIAGFSADRLLGSSFDPLNAALGANTIDVSGLASTRIVDVVLSGQILRLTTNPMRGADGTYLGVVIEWLDRTQEVAAEKEVGSLVEKAALGDFTARIPVDGKNGFFLKIAEDLNSLVNTADKGLNDVARVLGAIAKGDLTEKITADYAGTFGDLKHYCNNTTESLTNILSDIRVAAETIYTASGEIAVGNSDLSSRTEQQAANLEETASSMEELTSTVKLNADNAKQANVLAERASTVATDGGELIQQVVLTMSSINESSQKIADIIGVIDGIAFQTNILALNAAVEAARAGDQGRGFAVVASEVRTLAQRSANAAKDIKGLISDSVKKIESGNSLVAKSGNTMTEIVTAIKRVNDIMAEIAAASAEQSSGIEEVSSAVSNMDEMTQQNAALVEEAAAAAESLQSQADQLTTSVSQFRLSSAPGSSAKKTVTRIAAPLGKSAPKSNSIKKLSSPKNQDDEWESF